MMYSEVCAKQFNVATQVNELVVANVLTPLSVRLCTAVFKIIQIYFKDEVCIKS